MNFEHCNQKGCELIPCLEVFWPGKNPPPKYCVKHAGEAQNILNHMGISVVIRPYQPQLVGE